MPVSYPEIRTRNEIHGTGEYPSFPENCPVCKAPLINMNYWKGEYECGGAYYMSPHVQPAENNLYIGSCPKEEGD